MANAEETNEQILSTLLELTQAIESLNESIQNSSRDNNNNSQEGDNNKKSQKENNNKNNIFELDKISKSMEKFKNTNMFQNLKASNIQGLIQPFKKLNVNAGDFKANMGSAIKGIKGANLAAALLEPLIKVNNFLKDQILSNIDKFITKTLDLTESLYDVSVDLQKTLGISRKDSMFSIESYKDIRYIGANIGDLSNAHKDLFQNVSNFSMLTEGSQKILREQATILEKNGLSLGSYSAGIQIATKSMNMTAEEASKMNSRIVALAMDIGVSVEKMGSDLKSSSNIMAKLGSNGEQAFRRLAVAAKVTGMEMSRIVSITEKFDTFQGAAEQAGKLNAALGGNFVNAMDLMSATDPVERFDMIKNSILNAGLTFDTMSYYQKNFYKEALGLNDVGELALVLSGNMKSLGGDIGKTSADFEKMAKRAQKLQSLKDFFTNLFYNSIVPVLDKAIPKIEEFVDGLTGKDATEKFARFIKSISQAVSVIGLLVGSLTAVLAIALLIGTGGTATPISLALLGVAAASGTATTAVGGLGLSFSEFIGSSEEAGNSMTKLFDSIKEVGEAFIEPIMEVNKYYDKTKKNTNNIATLISSLKPVFKFIGMMIAAIIILSKETGNAIDKMKDIFHKFEIMIKTLVTTLSSLSSSFGILNFSAEALRFTLIEKTGSPTFEQFTKDMPDHMKRGSNESLKLGTSFDNLSFKTQSFHDVLSNVYPLTTKLIENLSQLKQIAFDKVNDSVIDTVSDTIESIAIAKANVKQAIMQDLTQISKDVVATTVKGIAEITSNLNITVDSKLVMDNKVLATAINKSTDESLRKAIRYGSGVA